MCTPGTNSVVITRSLDSGQMTSGTFTAPAKPASALMRSRKRAWLRASCV